VLGIVEDRQQHVEVVERGGQPHGAGEVNVQVTRVAPVRHRRVEWHRGRRDQPAKRLEHPPRQVSPAAARQRRDVQLERQRRVG
jgi:RNA 3'-terminal phosphate cyclase